MKAEQYSKQKCLSIEWSPGWPLKFAYTALFACKEVKQLQTLHDTEAAHWHKNTLKFTNDIPLCLWTNYKHIQTQARANTSSGRVYCYKTLFGSVSIVCTYTQGCPVILMMSPALITWEKPQFRQLTLQVDCVSMNSQIFAMPLIPLGMIWVCSSQIPLKLNRKLLYVTTQCSCFTRIKTYTSYLSHPINLTKTLQEGRFQATKTKINSVTHNFSCVSQYLWHALCLRKYAHWFPQSRKVNTTFLPRY